MKPERITAAHLMTMRAEPDGARAIASLLGVTEMPAALGLRTKTGIAEFLATGDATVASQLIHAALVRQRRDVPRAGGATDNRGNAG